MSVKTSKTENKNEIKLEFNIEAEKFEDAIKTVYEKNKKYFNIPGFRKGKVPMNMVEKYYGVKVFYEDAFNEVVPEVYERALEENKIEAVSKPDIDITQMEKGKELIFTAVVQTKPEDKTEKYKGIEIKKIEYNVSDDDIKHELEHMQEKNARLLTIEDRPVEDGDITIIDFEGFIDGAPFDGGKAKNHELTIGSHTFIEGFEEQLIGMKKDEEKEINVKFPEEYFSKELAGKPAMFKVKLHEIKKKELPALDDEFAKDASEFDTLEQLKESIKKRLQEENEHRAKHETEDAVIKAIADVNNVEIPSGMIETEIDNIAKDVEARLSYQGITFENYLKMIGKTTEDFRKEYSKQAEENVKTRLLLEAIANVEKIDTTEQEIMEKIKEMAEKYNKKEEELKDNEQLKNYLKENLKTEKVIDFLVKNAKIK